MTYMLFRNQVEDYQRWRAEFAAHADAHRAEVVRLRFWAGLDEAETAELLDVSPRTMRRDWKLARAWLSRELEA